MMTSLYRSPLSSNVLKNKQNYNTASNTVLRRECRPYGFLQKVNGWWFRYFSRSPGWWVMSQQAPLWQLAGGNDGHAVRGGRDARCSSRRGGARADRGVCSVARAARGHTSLLALRRRAASPLCRTTRPLGASRGPRARPASLLLLVSWLAAANTAAASDPACPQDPPTEQPACASCRYYENAREYSLQLIRDSLLAKLAFERAPNTTGRQLPPVPADLMERYERRPPPPGVQADAPANSRTLVSHTEPDDFLARTDNVFIFAR